MLSRKHIHHGLRIQAYQGVGLVIMGKECPLFEIRRRILCLYWRYRYKKIKNIKQILNWYFLRNPECGIFSFTNGDNINVCICVEDIKQVKVLTFQVKLFAPWMCLKPLVKVIMALESFIVFCVRDNFYCSLIPAIFRGLWQIFYGASVCILRCNIERQSRNSIAPVWAPCKKGCQKEFRTSHCLW